jgi:hypothetical protein
MALPWAKNSEFAQQGRAHAGRLLNMPDTAAGKIEIENVNHRGYVTRVDAAKYRAVRRGLLAILPRSFPGLTAKEMREGLLAHLPDDLFPGGAKVSWWAKTVQLDLEAKGIVRRENTKPLRWRKA